MDYGSLARRPPPGQGASQRHQAIPLREQVQKGKGPPATAQAGGGNADPEVERERGFAPEAPDGARPVLRGKCLRARRDLRRASEHAAATKQARDHCGRVVKRQADADGHRQRHLEPRPGTGAAGPSLADGVAARHRGRAEQEQRRVDPQQQVRRFPAQQDGRQEQEPQHDEQRIAEARGQVRRRRKLDPQLDPASKDPRQQLAQGLGRAASPPVLLALEVVDAGRQIGGRRQVGQEREAPSGELHPVGEVEVLGQRVELPAAGVLDRLAPPDARGAVEVEEAPGPVARLLLDEEVPVEQDRLGAGQQGVPAIRVIPARLDHAEPGIGEGRRRTAQKVRPGYEVGVEDRDQLAARPAQTGRQGPCLEALAFPSTEVSDRRQPATLLRRLLKYSLDSIARVVGRVVEDLDLQPLRWIVEVEHGPRAVAGRHSARCRLAVGQSPEEQRPGPQ